MKPNEMALSVGMAVFFVFALLCCEKKHVERDVSGAWHAEQRVKCWSGGEVIVNTTAVHAYITQGYAQWKTPDGQYQSTADCVIYPNANP